MSQRKIFFSRWQQPARLHHEVSVTGEKSLHSPPDIFCLSLTSPPLPLFLLLKNEPLPSQTYQYSAFEIEFTLLWILPLKLNFSHITKRCIKSTQVNKGRLFCSVRSNQQHQMFPDKNTDRQPIQKSLREEETFSNLCRDAVSLYFPSKRLQGVWALPRSARMGDMGRRVRLPAWDGRHRTFEAIWFSPNMSPELITTGGGQGAVLIRGPLSARRKEAECERRWKSRRGGVWGNECVKDGCGCPKDVTALKATCD